MVEFIVSDKLNKPKVPLSHAARVGNLLFTSGITPFNTDRQITSPDFAAQMHQVMRNLEAVLADAGTSLAHVVKTNIILQRQSDFWPMNEIYRQYFTKEPYPARTTIVADLASDELLLEIECIAEIP